jgi:long-chain acyl-CoA synthetase
MECNVQQAEKAVHTPVMSVREAHSRLTAAGERFEMELLTIRGRQTRVWKNGPKSIVEVLLNSRNFPEREFIVYEGQRVNYGTFHKAVAAMASRLIEDGVRKGDRVAVAMRNLPEWLVAFFAASATGAVVTPLNAWWTAAELEFGLRDSGAKVAFLDAERFQRLQSLDAPITGMKSYVARCDEQVRSPEVTPIEDVIGPVDAWASLPEAALQPVAIDADDDATMLYTSGTTGRPKGALSTHRSMTSATMATAFAAARDFVRYGEPLPETDPAKTPQRVTLLVIPMFHVTGFAATLLPLINGAGKLVLMHKFDAEKALGLIERERVTATGGVPTIAWQIIDHPRVAEYDLSSLVQLTYGGGLAPPELVRRIKRTLGSTKPGNGWGMTETSGTFASHLGRDYELHPESCGPAAPTGDLEIRNPLTAEILPAGEVGELWVRGPGIVRGYWNRPDETSKTFVDGWLRTGDLAKIDEEGFCYIIDRIKDMVIRGGENIYCAEVENHFHGHAAVAEIAVIGLPHQSLGEEVAAVVVVRDGMTITADELKDWGTQALAAYKVPTKFLVLTGELPKNAAGKVLKAPLKQLFASV